MKDKKTPGYIESFLALYREKKYPHAFIIASKYPKLKNTPEYAKMQEHFHTLLKLAALHIKKDELHKAQELIGEYARIDEKRVIVKLLLQFGEEFLDFLKAVQNKELQKVFAALELHPDFAKVPSFVALKMQMEEKLASMEEQMNTMELESDYSLLWEWEEFLSEAKRLQKKLATLRRLQECYKEERWDACYAMIDEEDLTADSLLAQLLQKHWYKRLEQAKRCALQGDIEEMYRVLQDFTAVASKKEQIKRLLYTATKRRIADLIKRGDFDKAERLLFETAEHFGKQEELMELAELYYEKSGTKVVFG